MKNTKLNNPPAFACITNDYIQEGMTLRDYFANSAMQGIITNSEIYKAIAKSYNIDNDKQQYNALAKEVYDIADAMLKQREL